MHQSWKSLSVIFGAVFCGALLTGAIMSLPSQMTSGIYADQVNAAAQARQHLNTAEGLSTAFRNVSETLTPSVVSISTRTKAVTRGAGRESVPRELENQLPPWLHDEFFRQFEAPQGQTPQNRAPERTGMGSGVIAREDGFILTNNHVVEGADELIVELSDGRKVEGKVVGTDPPTDLAVVKIDVDGLKPAVFGDSDAIQVGDWVLAIGSPFGLAQTVTAGIISGKNRVQNIVGDGAGFEDFLQTDAAINPGNSGGPLVNLRGELVGINTAILSRSGTSAGIGFAIPVSMARPVLDSIIESGTVHRGFIGAQVADINPDVIKEFDLKAESGALIRGVVAGEPAANAGLQPGDVVTSIDGKSIATGTQLRNWVASKAPGSSVVMSVNRNGKQLDLTVKLQERTDEKLALLNGDDSDVVMGAKLEPITEETARDLGIEDASSGLVITGIEDGSIAAQGGLAAGDVIEQVGGRPVKTVNELKQALVEAKESGRGTRMVIRRGNVRSLIIIR